MFDNVSKVCRLLYYKFFLVAVIFNISCNRTVNKLVR